jgi:hypothetical protein
MSPAAGPVTAAQEGFAVTDRFAQREETSRSWPRWPLLVIAAPAAVAVWSGWVGLGAMCGFGLVQPLPGIAAWHLDTAITLPVGVEAYAVYALGTWLAPGTPAAARTFARRSAIGALVLGALGQVVYHLLAAAHATAAPWPVVVLVSCMPVFVLGCAAALTHLLRVPAENLQTFNTEKDLEPVPEPVPVPERVPAAVSDAVPRLTAVPDADVTRVLDELGTDASIRAIKAALGCGQPRAKEIQQRIQAS